MASTVKAPRSRTRDAKDVAVPGQSPEDQYDMSGERQAFLLCVKEERNGAETDLEKVRQLLSDLNFSCEECIDPTNEKIIQELTRFRDEIKDWRKVSCLFVFIMAHGDLGKIDGVDRGSGVELEEIFSLFDNENCSGLQLKPKVFVIQACRGDKIDEGVKFAGFRSLNQNDEEETVPKRLPTISDTFTVYPSQPGYVAYRNSCNGSAMITNMVDVFGRFRNNLHLYDLFVKVNQKMIKETHNLKGKDVKTTLVMESTLTKAVYLTE